MATDTVKGFAAARRAFQALPQITRDRLNVATETTVREIARSAKARLASSPSIQTRSLYNAVGWSMNLRTGRGKAGVGNVTTVLSVGGRTVRVRGVLVAGKGGSASTAAGARKINPKRYAHLVEKGARHMAAEPFMVPSAEAETQPYLRRCQVAGRAIEQAMATIGSRYL